MTSQEKRDRRVARHELMEVFNRVAVRQMGLFATNRQIKAATKVLVDRYYAEQIRPAAERIAREVLEKGTPLAS